MENKKQLIVIPPMSEALKKLYQVLEGISGDENVEISMIDDLKELSQFVASTGQCLILASNAKKCATFLQDNKAMLAKNHCKTILFTPKEIPSKTLIKFTKIGLTESILESSPPKTFLYKIKLQLRSIKSINPLDDSEKMIKSLENNKPLQSEITDFEIKEKSLTEDSIIENTRTKKKSFEESIDYLDPLKENDRLEEENIDTMWKTNRKKTIDLNITEEKNATLESDNANIDMYYRSKKNKLDSMLEFDEEEPNQAKESHLIDLENSSAKKSTYADVIDEGYMKEKKLNQTQSTFEEDQKKAIAEIDLIIAPKKNKNIFEDLDSELDINLNRRRQERTDNEGAKTKDKMLEDLGGYLKGKIAHHSEILEENEKKKNDNYDNSDIDEQSAQMKIDLDLSTKAQQKAKENLEEELLNDSHDGVVDKLDNNMFGDSGTVDIIRTRMNGALKDSKSDQEEQLTSDHKREKISLNEEFSKKHKDLNKDNSLDQDLEADHLVDLAEADEEELELKNSKKESLSNKDDNLRDLLASDDTEEENQQKQNSIDLQLEKASNSHDPGADEDLASSLRSRKSSVIQPKKQANQIHDGLVDKIDSFYRGGDSSKKEQNWDNLIDKKNAIESTEGSKRSGMRLLSAEKQQYDETTIDYRKLKAEFEQMSSGANEIENNDGLLKTDTHYLRNEDNGSFKVLEINPLCLDFSINVVSSILNVEFKPKNIFTMISNELLDNYNGYSVFYNYNISDKNFSEVFNSFNEIQNTKITLEKKIWWNEFKSNTPLFEHFHKLTMTTWRCPEIVKNNEIWEDVELPSWAQQELINKHLELIFPYFDGLDRMGLAITIFPEGLDPKTVNDLLTSLEMARTLFLDTIVRAKSMQKKEDNSSTDNPDKKLVSSFFNGLFGKKKAS